MATWYSKTGDQQFGPYTDQELKRAVDVGKITPDTLIRQGENGNWFRASQIAGLLPPAAMSIPPQATATPSGTEETRRQAGQHLANASKILGIFDFGFTVFLTPKLISIYWTIFVVVLTLVALISTLMILVHPDFPVLGKVVLPLGIAIVWILILVWHRIFLEWLIVIFKIERHLRGIHDKH